MKKIFISLTLLLFAFLSNSQVINPVDFTFSSKKKVGNNYEVTITATLNKGWHIYSQNSGKLGPIPTSITFNANPLIKLVGKAKEVGSLVKTFDKNFNSKVLYFNNKVSFVQTITLKAPVKTNITGLIEYMLCDDNKCLPPTKKTFDIAIQ